jgi:two-component system nitrogen regulation sensor histidine kinase GlnL
LTTGYRPGVKFGAGLAGERVSLPLEVTVRDNGSGVPADLLPYIFDPFVTTKVRGSGLGLALVAKIVGDHGGVVGMRLRCRGARFSAYCCRKRAAERVEHACDHSCLRR